jgi:prefoldin subunit 5
VIRMVLGLCLSVGFVVPAFADPVMGETASTSDSKKSFDSSISDATQKLTKLEAKKDVLNKSISETQQRITSAYVAMKSAEQNLDKAAGGATVPLTDKQRDLYQKAKSDYEKAKADNGPALNKLKGDANTLDTELKAVSITVKSEKFGDVIQTKSREIAPDAVAKFNQAKLDKQNTLLQTRLRVADLRMNFMDLDLKANGIESTLNDMEKIYDKTVLGAYLQDKFGQLLNSQSICSAIKRCAVSDPKKIDAEKIRQELFPESQAIRSDYYDKVNKKQAPSVQ